MPLAFSNSSNIGRAQFSGQIEYTLSVSAARTGAPLKSATSTSATAAIAWTSRGTLRGTPIMVIPPLTVADEPLGFLCRLPRLSPGCAPFSPLKGALSNRTYIARCLPGDPGVI
jgi:hypothetical protein